MTQPNQTNTVPFANGGAEVVALYLSGLSIPAVAKRLGVHDARVSRLLRKLKIPRRSCYDAVYQKSGWVAPHVEGPVGATLSLTAIAALYRGRVY